MSGANPYRGEASLKIRGETIVIRPSFGALVAAEEELGPLFALVERAAEGKLGIGEIAALFDHLSREGRPAGITRDRIGEAIVEQGLAGVSPQLKLVLGQILQGHERPLHHSLFGAQFASSMLPACWLIGSPSPPLCGREDVWLASGVAGRRCGSGTGVAAGRVLAGDAGGAGCGDA